MSNAVQNIGKVNNGLCPHGMSPGGCPICSGMGGSRLGERPQKPGEMSYHQCAMIGAMMKARALRQEAHEKSLQTHADNLANFEKNMETIASKMAEFASNISKNFLTKPIAFVINNLVIPVFNSVKNIPRVISNLINTISQIKEKFIDIQDKLNAIFGEAKAFVEKKVSELITSIKTKFEGLFKVFKRNNTKDDETKIDEDKKIFNLKKFIQKIWKKEKDDRENNAGS